MVKLYQKLQNVELVMTKNKVCDFGNIKLTGVFQRTKKKKIPLQVVFSINPKIVTIEPQLQFF